MQDDRFGQGALGKLIRKLFVERFDAVEKYMLDASGSRA